MSRSFRHTQIHSNGCAKSEKSDKRMANRKLRKIVRQKIQAGDDDLPDLKEVSQPWCFAKDGKQYFELDNDPNSVYNKGMRK